MNTRRTRNLERWLGADTELPVIAVYDDRNPEATHFTNLREVEPYRIVRRANRVLSALRAAGFRGEATVYRRSGEHNTNVLVSTPGGRFVLMGRANSWGWVTGIFGPEVLLSVLEDGRKSSTASRRIRIDTSPVDFRDDLLSAMTSALAGSVWAETVDRPGHRSEIRRAYAHDNSVEVDLFASSVGHLVTTINLDSGYLGQLTQVVNYGNYVRAEGAFGNFLRAELRKALGATGDYAEVTGPFVRMLAARVHALANIVAPSAS